MQPPRQLLGSEGKRLRGDWRKHRQRGIASEVHRQARIAVHPHCRYGQEAGGSYGRVGRKEHVRKEVHGHFQNHFLAERRRHCGKGILTEGSEDQDTWRADSESD